MSHDPLDHGRRNVVLASGAAVALGLAGRAAAALDSTSKERRMSTLVIRNARITTLDPRSRMPRRWPCRKGASWPSAATRRSCAAGATKRP